MPLLNKTYEYWSARPRFCTLTFTTVYLLAAPDVIDPILEFSMVLEAWLKGFHPRTSGLRRPADVAKVVAPSV